MPVGTFNCVAMLLNNKITSIFINVAQHEQYEQQQVYVIKMPPIDDCMSKQPQSSSEEVKIRLKHRDWEVEITCLENKVKQVVEHVLSGIDNSYTNIDPTLNNQLTEVRKEIDSLKLQISSGNINQIQAINTTELQRKAIPKGGTTCRGLLEILLYEGYFGTEKHLGEVHEELSRRGYNYDRTAVSHSLTDMVRESILTRLGTMRNYQYIQKRPPSESLF
jgi:hypothetical protein